MSKRILTITIILSLALPLAVRAQEAGLKVFGAEPMAQEQSKGRNIASCLAGWRQFISAGIGYESSSDYFRDFFLWPLHYSDVASIERQLEKSRLAVMATFLRCDLTKLQAATDAYYKLEAELYFVRHYVDTGGGFLKILTENIDGRDKFENDMMNYLILRKKNSDPEKDKALFSGYFDLFNEKYKERAKAYKSFGEDPVYKELGKKFDELIDTFKSFKKIGGEIEKADQDNVETKKTEKQPSVANAPAKSIKEKVSAIFGKFIDACVETDSNTYTQDSRYCLFGESRKSEKPFAPSGQTKSSQKKAFGDVIATINRQEIQKTEDLTRAQMLARYEVLYGEINGQGVSDMLKKMNKFEAILTNGDDKDKTDIVAGSLEPLKNVNKCASDVLARQCK